jgi:predicted nucleotidyltransferase
VTDLAGLLRALAAEGVEFIVVDGVAATIHGSARLTQDIDVVYRRSGENLRRLVRALQPLRPYLRGAPAGLPFRFDEGTLRSGLNFTLTTDLGAIDLLGEVVGGGGWEELSAHVVPIDVFGVRVQCVDLPWLIHLKRAAGRPKDLEVIGELERLAEERAQET